jgi:hypothetical protein
MVHLAEVLHASIRASGASSLTGTAAGGS